MREREPRLLGGVAGASVSGHRKRSIAGRQIGVLLLCIAAAASTRPQAEPLTDAELDQLTAEVAEQLRCPVCRNQSVLESSSGLAREMQALMRERLAAGETPEQVKAYFVERYGEWILLQPEPRGINLLVYLLPAAGLIAGALIFLRQMRRWTGAAEASGPRSGSAAADRATRPEADPAPSGSRLKEEEEEWIKQQIGSLG